MSEFPSLPLFTDAFIADTTHLDAQATGAYALLMMMAWRTPECRLPDDDSKLTKWARVDLRTWRRIKPEVMAFWRLADGYWTQKRLSKEREIVSKRAEVARNNGKHGGRPKPLENNEPENPAGSSWVTQKKAPNPNPSKGDERENAHARGNGVTAEAISITENIFAEFGLEWENLPRPWNGFAYTVQMWLNVGCDRDFIMSKVLTCGSKSRLPHPNYLDATVRNAWNERATTATVVSLESGHAADDHRAYPASRAIQSGAADPILAGVGRYAAKRAAQRKSAGPDDEEVPRCLDPPRVTDAA